MRLVFGLRAAVRFGSLNFEAANNLPGLAEALVNMSTTRSSGLVYISVSVPDLYTSLNHVETI